MSQKPSVSPSSSGFKIPAVVALDGGSDLPREILGNKGFGINAMHRSGLPVPPAFCTTTEMCSRVVADLRQGLDDAWDQVCEGMRWLKEATSRTFGAGPRPLLISVRSGAAQSMPGMLDTVLNLGMTDAVAETLEAATSARFAADTRNRFTHMYQRIVGGEELAPIPKDPWIQLRQAVEAVLVSWNKATASAHRPELLARDVVGPPGRGVVPTRGGGDR